MTLTNQPSPLPTRKVVASSLAASIGGPLVTWACVQLLDFQLTPDCAAQISEGVLYALLGIGGALSGLLSFAAGYMTRERERAPQHG